VKLFTIVELQAADMVARGIQNTQICQHLGRSPAWLEQLNRSDSFRERVNGYRQQYMASIQQATQQNIFEDIQYSQRWTRIVRTELLELSLSLVSKAHRATLEITEEELLAMPVKQRFEICRIAAEVAGKALDVDDRLLGIERLVKNMEAIERLGGFGDQTTNASVAIDG
jgi:hypothetical protein